MRMTAHALKVLRSGHVDAIFRKHAPTSYTIPTTTVVLMRQMHVLTRRHPENPIPDFQRNGRSHNAVELHYTDEMLEDFYKSLLDPEPVDQSRNRAISHSAPLKISPTSAADLIAILEERFAANELCTDRHLESSATSSDEHDTLVQPHIRLLRRVTAVVESAERLMQGHPSPIKTAPSSPMISHDEWLEIIRRCVHLNDIPAVEHALDLMLRSGLYIAAGWPNFVMGDLANTGRVAEFERVIQLLERHNVPLDEDIRSLHLKAYIRAGRLKDACDLIHTYENRNLAPSMKTYSYLISRLFLRTSATPSTRALAWDMFAHMRYVAHPTPDAYLYAIMIRACADAPIPQAERALDLFTEMRIDNRIEPTRDAYNWTILTCARASKDFAHDAFRLAQEMFDSSRTGAVQMRPDLNTFCALLESAKRSGDLKRARWILAELINAYQKGDESLRPNEEVMAHVFQVYTSYQPPFNRDVVRRTQETNSEGAVSETREISSTKGTRVEPDITVDLPQSHAETISEAATLYSRIRDDILPVTSTEPAPGLSIFSHVTPTPDLLNSYISVYFAHASLASARTTYEAIFAELGTRRTPRTYLLALQRCGISRTEHDRRDALPFARSVWEDWRKMEDSESVERERSAAPPKTSPRTVEKLWSSMIRVLTLAGRLDEALGLVKEFAAKYPPLDIKYRRSSQPPTTAPAPPGEYRTYLTGSRPLVRLTTNTYIADGSVPPHFIFRDIEILHHRLLIHDRLKDVGYLKWLHMSYQGALKKRREATIGIVPKIVASPEPVVSVAA